jgi:uncharacterized OsmC-like protein
MRMQPSLASRPQTLNGVDVAAFEATVASIKANAEIAKFNFRAVNRWMGGDKNRSTIKEFTGALGEQREGVQAFVADNGEHPVLLGHDEAPNPIEWLLHALIGCMTTATAYHAAAAGIAVSAIESDIEGDLDLRGFLGLAPKERKGLSAVRVRMRVRTSADAPTIKALAAMSPVLDVVSRALPVSIAVETYA